MKMSSQRIIDCYGSTKSMPITIDGSSGNITITINQIDLVNVLGNSCSSEVEQVSAPVAVVEPVIDATTIDEVIVDEECDKIKDISQELREQWKRNRSYYIHEAKAIQPPATRINAPTKTKSPIWLAGVMTDFGTEIKWKCMYDGCPSNLKVHRKEGKLVCSNVRYHLYQSNQHNLGKKDKKRKRIDEIYHTK